MLCRQFGSRLGINTGLSSGRGFVSVSKLYEKVLPPRRVIDENEITESFLKGSGPGGQKINKTSSAVQLRHGPTGIVVKCQETRSRDQNRKLARQILGERLDELEKGDQSRTAIKAERARSKKASAAKKSRRKYNKLEDEKAAQSDDGVQDELVDAADESRRDRDHANKGQLAVDENGRSCFTYQLGLLQSATQKTTDITYCIQITVATELSGIRAQTLANAKILLKPTAELCEPSMGSQATLLAPISPYEGMDVVVFGAPGEYVSALMVGLKPAIEGEKALNPEGAIRKLFLTTSELLKTCIPKIGAHQRNIHGGGVFDGDMISPDLMEAQRKLSASL